jgi:hypothetical protein
MRYAATQVARIVLIIIIIIGRSVRSRDSSNMCFIRQGSQNLLAMLVDDAHDVSSTQAFLYERKARVCSR